MDEGLLNDLLECSVCLERLDTSSRVLPCQHTFCLKCLKVIVESHKELRCPECRVLVEARVDELPPNVLLMRILEGMKSAPRKASARQERTRHTHQVQSSQPPTPRGADGKPVPPHARAIHDYISKEVGDLSFKKGETIVLVKRLDPFWYHGECGGRSGVFPITYVQVVIPLQIPTALCKALYDFRMSAPDEEGCLAFDKGAVITVHRRVDENWAEGRLGERLGIFPIAFVELNQAARALMNSPTLNRPVPPPELARPPHADHRHAATHSHRYQHMSMSAPPIQGAYQNVGAMSQSQPSYHNAMMAQPPIIGQPRATVEPHSKHMELIHNITGGHVGGHVGGQVGVQSQSRIGDFDRRNVKYDHYSTKPEATYQNVRTPTVAHFNSSDSSSTVTTPSVGASCTTTPNTSSDTSMCESAEPSLPSSPENRESERNTTLTPAATAQSDAAELNTSLGVLSLNESSTATNTALNVSLPTEGAVNDSGSNVEPSCQPLPSSSKGQNPVRSGPESMLFGLGLQAALSPSHAKEGYLRGHREREKRNSLTPSSYNASQNAQNRHSAEILATSLPDAAAARARRRRPRSSDRERALPAAYVALYAYRPQKADELELKKGAIYTVTERCRDGWYKGRSERSRRAGVFPGNYVTPAPAPAAAAAGRHDQVVPSAVGVKPAPSAQPPPAPQAPPRADSPVGAQAGAQAGAHGAQAVSAPAVAAWPAPAPSKNDKQPKDKTRADKPSTAGASAGAGLMRRLAAMKRSRSPPPPASYCLDNPVFDAGPGPSAGAPAHHVRSGSCPSQLPTAAEARGSAALRPRPARPSVLPDRPGEGPWQTQHRKSQSLDVTATRRDRHAPPTKERFRCIAPYPPNSEYELELKVDDIVLVHRKRGDGWYKGTLQRTGRTGLFPASFVQSAPAE